MTIASRRAVLGVAVIAVSCAVAACGSSSGGSTTSRTASAGTFSRSTFAACLKKHGVTLPARPPGGGSSGGGAPPGGGPPAGGRFFGGRGSGRFFNPKFRAAFRACGGARFRGGFRGRGRFKLSHTAVNSFVACVRKHGFNMPAPNFSGKGPIFSRSIETNAKFRTASRACASLLRPSSATGNSSAS